MKGEIIIIGSLFFLKILCKKDNKNVNHSSGIVKKIENIFIVGHCHATMLKSMLHLICCSCLVFAIVLFQKPSTQPTLVFAEQNTLLDCHTRDDEYYPISIEFNDTCITGKRNLQLVCFKQFTSADFSEYQRIRKGQSSPVADHQTGSFQVSFTVPFCNPISSSTLRAHVHVHLPGAYILNISPMQEFASE